MISPAKTVLPTGENLLHLPMYCIDVLNSLPSFQTWEISAALQQMKTSSADQDPSVPGFAELRLPQRVYRKWYCSLQVLL